MIVKKTKFFFEKMKYDIIDWNNMDIKELKTYLCTLLLIFAYSGSVKTCIVYGTEQLEESLCKSKMCSFYSKCKLDEHSFVAKCICPDDCGDIEELTSIKNAVIAAAASQLYMITGSTLGQTFEISGLDRPFSLTKSREDILRSLFGKTVCGSDGKDYENFCELKKESCRSSRDIKIFYFGKCSNYFIYLFLYDILDLIFNF